MPGWHEQVKDLVADGKLVLLGVTQEQHAERCRLFAQWKGFNWPILHDPINLLASKAVPLTVAIDELGIVRSTKPTPDWVRDSFVGEKRAGAERGQESKVRSTRRAVPALDSRPLSKPNIKDLQRLAQTRDDAESYRALGDAAMLWDRSQPSLAVDAYNTALQKEDSGVNHFRLGVALRRRHETASRQQSDFARAVSHWTAALTLDPNQYIWRRRIQQYGPRLDKPYPFYDWIDRANKEILARGETPIALKTGLSGAEIAHPAKEFETSVTPDTSPDPGNKITRDNAEFVRINSAVVPSRVKAGENVRLHLELSLNSGTAVWNNESEPLQVWIHDQPGWTPQRSLVAYTGVPGAAESDEVRRVEVEFKSSDNAKDASVRGFALYYICEKSTGTCMLRRQDFSFHANIR